MLEFFKSADVYGHISEDIEDEVYFYDPCVICSRSIYYFYDRFYDMDRLGFRLIFRFRIWRLRCINYAFVMAYLCIL